MFEITEESAQEITRGFSIPPQPEILRKIQEEGKQEYPDIDRISGFVSLDVGLSAFLLKTINSPATGLNRSVGDVKQAAMFLGLKSLYPLISYYELKSSFKQSESCISLERFWDGSAESARMCSLLVKHLDLSSDCPMEYAYAVGLFHDCGIAALASKFPNYRETLGIINDKPGKNFTETEDAIYNTNHAVIGYFILSSWNMPKLICDFVGRHHDPTLFLNSKTDIMQRNLFGILKLSDNTLSHHHRGVDDTEWQIYKSDILDYFGLSEEDHEELQGNLIDDFLEN